MWPLCRIFSISAADLQTIAMLRVMIFQYPVNLTGNVVYRQIAVYRNQPACTLIVIRNRTRQLLKCRESWLNYFQPVVIAGLQLRPVRFIANFINRGGWKWTL